MAGDRRSNRDILFRFFEILNTGEYDHLEEVVERDFVTETPQFNERIRGVDNFRSMMSNYPGGRLSVSTKEQLIIEGDEGRYLLTPMFTMLKVKGTGDSLIASVRTRYPDGSDWYIIGFMSYRDGKIVKQVLYFAPISEPPEWRSQWAEPMEGDS